MYISTHSMTISVLSLQQHHQQKAGWWLGVVGVDVAESRSPETEPVREQAALEIIQLPEVTRDRNRCAGDRPM